MKPLELKGKRFARLSVIKHVGSNAEGSRLWRCLCSCGKTTTVVAKLLMARKVKSCGCLRVDMIRQRSTRHGMHGSSEYIVWQRMRQRCVDKNERSYPDYGGRGIFVCKRWQDFPSFYQDMGPRPSSKHTIERNDVNGNYEPSNCRWLLKKFQARNARSVVLSMDIARTLRAMKRRGESIAAWATAHNINRNTAYRAANGETWR